MKAPIDNFCIEQYPKGDVTQYFGENKALYSRLNLAGHNGIDIVAPHGSPMYAVESGIVVESRYATDPVKDLGGHCVRIITHGKECRVWTYGHCSKLHVKQGDIVEEGQHIADMGNTGFVISGATPYWELNPFAGTHLHLGLRNVTRNLRGWAYEGSDIKMKVYDLENGFKGSVDPYSLLKTVSTPNEETEKVRLLTIISLLNKVVELYKQLNLLKK
jgi:murein DD-endopeptidase MepM/ murein hydrolase activator NlpD